MWTVDSKSQITNLNYTSLNAQDLSKQPKRSIPFSFSPYYMDNMNRITNTNFFKTSDHCPSSTLPYEAPHPCLLFNLADFTVQSASPVICALAKMNGGCIIIAARQESTYIKQGMEFQTDEKEETIRIVVSKSKRLIYSIADVQISSKVQSLPLYQDLSEIQKRRDPTQFVTKISIWPFSKKPKTEIFFTIQDEQMITHAITIINQSQTDSKFNVTQNKGEDIYLLMMKMAKERLKPTSPISKTKKYKAETPFNPENFNIQTIEKKKNLQNYRLSYFW